jgi:hypothetical protein
MDVTTVADDIVVVHDGLESRRYEGLAADTEHTTSTVCRFARSPGRRASSSAASRP